MAELADSAAVSVPRRPLVLARRACAGMFFINGAMVASWVPHVATVQHTLSLGPGLLGLALLGLAGGAVIAMPSAGWLIGRIGSRAVTRLATLIFAAALALPVVAPSLALLAAALVLLGAANGAMDVAVNAQAVAIERPYGRPIMSSFHALFSVGGLVGAGLAALLLTLGIAPATHLIGVAVVMAAATLVVAARLLTGDTRTARAGRRFARPRGALMLLGVIGFLTLFGEGAVADWSAVYLRTELGTGAGTAALGFAAFSLAMAVARFTGDGLTRRFGPVAVVRISAIVAAVGMTVALSIGQPVAGIIGFGCVGLGLANIVPIAFSAAARTPGMSAGSAIAAVATAGYLGSLAGPPLIGLAAEAVTLPAALGFVVLASALVAVLGHAVRPLA